MRISFRAPVRSRTKNLPQWPPPVRRQSPSMTSTNQNQTGNTPHVDGKSTPLNIYTDFPRFSALFSPQTLFPASGNCFEAPENVLSVRKLFLPPGNCFQRPDIDFSTQRLFEAFGRSFQPLEKALIVKSMPPENISRARPLKYGVIPRSTADDASRNTPRHS